MGTNRNKARAWALAAALAAAAAPASADQGQGLTKAENEALVAITKAAEKEDCDTILKRGAPLVERRQRALTGDVVAALYGLMAGCHDRANRREETYRLALLGTALPEASDGLWYLRLAWEMETKRFGELAKTLETMAQGHGAALNALPLPWMWGFLQDMKKAGATEARMRVLKLLASEAYAPAETFGSNEAFRFAYARDLLSAGASAEAGAFVRSLEEPHNIAAALLDTRMRAWVPSEDVAAAARKMLARNREWLARNPDRLRPLIAAATNLRQLGRAEEALELLRTAEPRLDRLAEAEDSDHVNWWWNEVALTYEFLNRPDEAVEAYRRGMKASEGGQPNVSQLINLALAQNRFGRPRDALETLAVRDLSESGASPYGTMLYRRARACAYHLDGRGGEGAADVEYIRSHEEDAPSAVTDLFLCLGDMEAAAASAVRRLDDPELRADLLLELSDYALAPPPLPSDRIAQNLEALKKRPDVRAAIERAGGTRKFNVAEL